MNYQLSEEYPKLQHLLKSILETRTAGDPDDEEVLFTDLSLRKIADAVDVMGNLVFSFDTKAKEHLGPLFRKDRDPHGPAHHGQCTKSAARSPKTLKPTWESCSTRFCPDGTMSPDRY